jgi:hypothetical protein
MPPELTCCILKRTHILGKENAVKPLPAAEGTLLIRLDFSNNGVGEEVCAAARQPGGELQEAMAMFVAVNDAMGQSMGEGEVETNLHVVDDPDYRDATVRQLLNLAAGQSSLLFIADNVTMSRPDHPILVVDAAMEPGRSFRALPSEAFGIESNLSIANMDREDFAQTVDDDGVFRGFRREG